MRQGPIQAKAGYSLLDGNLPLVYRVVHFRVDKSSKWTGSTVLAGEAAALNANFFLGYSGLSGGRGGVYRRRVGWGSKTRAKRLG